jgi:hypothetical protein
MIVYLLFILFGLSDQMGFKNFADSLKTVELVFLRLNAFVLFPN